jgi:hypothetical protein
MALTPKQERFCQVYIQTSNASEAYRSAYNAGGMKPATITKRASELLGNGDVAGRLAELRGAVATTHGVTVASLIAELEEARMIGKERGQASAMAAATMGKAKLAGLDKDAGDPDEGEPKPVKVVVEVRDARKPDADA